MLSCPACIFSSGRVCCLNSKAAPFFPLKKKKTQKQNVNMQNIFTERFLADHEDLFQFGDKTIISQYSLAEVMILQLAERLWPALEKPTLQHRALLVVFQLGWHLKKICQPAMSLLNLGGCSFHTGSKTRPQFVCQKVKYQLLHHDSVCFGLFQWGDMRKVGNTYVL